MEEKVAASAFGLQEHGLYPSLLTRPFGAPPQNCQDRTERGGFRRSEKGFFFPRPAVECRDARERWWLPLGKKMIHIPRPTLDGPDRREGGGSRCKKRSFFPHPTLVAFIAEERVLCPERPVGRGDWNEQRAPARSRLSRGIGR